MKSIQNLIERFWIIKSRDKDLYFLARAEMNSIEKFAREYPGWRVVSNERIIKIEKIPSYAQSFMGITDFQSNLDYAILCALLIFLEDKEDNEAFLLSEVVANIEIQLKEFVSVDWTRFSDRKSLIRVMQYAVKIGFLICHEGSIDDFTNNIQQEVLYENTGLSRYFAVNFSRDISDCKTYSDFERVTNNVDTDRGHFRSSRVYRRLVTSPAMYWDTTDDPDSFYLKNKRNIISKYLNDYLGGRLDIHRNSAYFVFEDDNNYGESFPKDSTISDIVVLLCTVIREHSEFIHEENDTVVISKYEFVKLVGECSEKYSFAWSKEYREMAVEKIAERVCEIMESWMLLERTDSDFIIYPGVYKFSGVYPKNIEEQRNNSKSKSSEKKQQDEALEKESQISLFYTRKR